MINKQLQELLKQYPDDAKIIIHVRAGSDHDLMYEVDGNDKDGYDVANVRVEGTPGHVYIGTKENSIE